MARETFYEALLSKRYSKKEFGKLVFRLEEDGPRYHVELRNNFSNPNDVLNKNNSYRIKMVYPGNHEINDPERKKVMLDQFFHNGRKI
jgi:hypothetical protein